MQRPLKWLVCQMHSNYLRYFCAIFFVTLTELQKDLNIFFNYWRGSFAYFNQLAASTMGRHVPVLPKYCLKQTKNTLSNS